MTCRLFEDIANYENMIEQLNNEKKKMNVKVHAADTYLTQVKELESAYRFVHILSLPPDSSA